MKKEKMITKSPQTSSYIACGGHLNVLHEQLIALKIYKSIPLSWRLALYFDERVFIYSIEIPDYCFSGA